MVNDGLLLFRVAAGFTEFSCGAGGGERFVDEDERGGGKALLQADCEFTDLRCGPAFAAIHADRQAEHERADLSDLRELADPLDGVAFGLVDGFDRVREDAEVISRGDANAGITVIDAKRRMRGI